MKKNNKYIKIIAMMLFAVSLCYINISAQIVYSEGYFKYILEDKSIIITDYFGKETEVVVPSSLRGYPVSKIAQGAFIENVTIQTLYLPETMMEIEEGALPKNISVIYESNTEAPVESGGKNTEDVFISEYERNDSNTVLEENDNSRADSESDLMVEYADVYGKIESVDIKEVPNVKEESENDTTLSGEASAGKEDKSKEYISSENDSLDNTEAVSKCVNENVDKAQKNVSSEKANKEKPAEENKQEKKESLDAVSDSVDLEEKSSKENTEKEVVDEGIFEKSTEIKSENELKETNKEEDSSDDPASESSEKSGVEATSQSLKSSTYSPVTIATVVIVLVICIIVLRKKNKK